ncbi:MAG: methyltransferase [Deltaproteobacteria bacterium]
MMDHKHTSDTILQTSHGFQASRVLLCGAELDLFTLLAEKPLSSAAVAAERNADPRGISILLDVLSALGYLIKIDGQYQTEPSAVPFLSADAPESLLPVILHQGRLWQSWSRITDIVLGKTTVSMNKTGALAEGSVKSFIGAMHVIASKKAPEVVAAIKPGKARRLLDVGGGSGTYTLAFLAAVPEMRATLFDLPPVIEMARDRVHAAGVEDRASLVPGDFYKDPLPPGHDLALLSAIIHQNSQEENKALYQRIHDALEPGGRIVVRDYVMSPDRTAPVEGAMFAVNMLAQTQGGSTYTYEEIADGLASAGFNRIRLIQTKGMFSLVEGFKKD